MKEKVLKVVQECVERANICLQQSEEGYEDGGQEAVARYHYWDGAHDMALEIERAIKNLMALEALEIKRAIKNL